MKKPDGESTSSGPDTDESEDTVPDRSLPNSESRKEDPTRIDHAICLDDRDGPYAFELVRREGYFTLRGYRLGTFSGAVNDDVPTGHYEMLSSSTSPDVMAKMWESRCPYDQYGTARYLREEAAREAEKGKQA